VHGSAVAIPAQTLLNEIHLRLLKAIEANPQATQRDLSRALGVSLGKANYCLRALISRGWVKANNFRVNPRKSAYAYLLTPSGIAAKRELTVNFLSRKVSEYEALKQEIDRLSADASRPALTEDSK
jgi:MarR family transcriptional regulator, temperature-dependent positive regulator of motility